MRRRRCECDIAVAFGWVIELACHRPPKVAGAKGGLWAACGLARGPAERNSVSGIVSHWIDAFVLTPCLKFSPRPPINIRLQQPQSSPSTSLNPPIVPHLLDHLRLSTPSTNPPFDAIALLRDHYAHYRSHGRIRPLPHRRCCCIQVNLSLMLIAAFRRTSQILMPSTFFVLVRRPRSASQHV